MVLACGSRESSEDCRSGGQAPATPAQPTEILSGFAVHGHEVRSFRPCGTEEPLWAVDRSGALWKAYGDLAFHNEPYEELFCIVEGRRMPAPPEGFGADYPGAIEIVEVLYMAKEGFRCNLDLARFQYRAYGNEPFWSVWITSDGITLKVLGSEDRTWEKVRVLERDAGATYVGYGPGDSIEVNIEYVPCHDTMSGAYFSSSARVITSHHDFRGCALRGTGGL
jgi:putative lipoprotein